MDNKTEIKLFSVPVNVLISACITALNLLSLSPLRSTLSISYRGVCGNVSRKLSELAITHDLYHGTIYTFILHYYDYLASSQAQNNGVENSKQQHA